MGFLPGNSREAGSVTDKAVRQTSTTRLLFHPTLYSILQRYSHIAGIFFTAEPQEKPKNTGVGSLSILQLLFLTQELNQGLLHCRQILYQLSYQGSPYTES